MPADYRPEIKAMITRESLNMQDGALIHVTIQNNTPFTAVFIGWRNDCIKMRLLEPISLLVDYSEGDMCLVWYNDEDIVLVNSRVISELREIQ